MRARTLLLLAVAPTFCLAVHKKLAVHTAAAPPAGPQSCAGTIPGNWTGFFPQPLGDLYELAWDTTAPTWRASCRTSCGWSTGHGAFSADFSTTTIAFDSGVNLTGTVSGNCSVIAWDNGSQWRVYTPPAVVTDVHIIAMNHLDVGYNGIPGLGLINNILNRYFQVYFPRAVSIAAQLRAHGGPERLIYTTHGFLLHLYLHCPASLNLSGIPLWCPPDADVAAMRAAVAAGDVVWHAGAFNTEYENAFNAELVAAQFQLSADLADELGVPRPRTLSLRDVPGTTRALLPILAAHNISALSVGVNSGSPAPAMPNPGVWLDPASGASALFLQTGQGQGYPNNPGPDPADPGGMGASSCVLPVYPLTHALCWAFRTDNSGPPEDVDEVFRQWDIAAWQFPGANVFASTFDNYTLQLEVVRGKLPVVSGEVGDTWVTSTTADPWKMVFYREAARAYTACLAAGACDPHEARVAAFLRLLIKLPEHTWGLPGLADSTHFTNADFHAAIAAGEPAYLDALHSYTEQNDIATVAGVAALADHPLAAEIAARMAALVPAAPDVAGLTPVPAAAWATPVTVRLPGGGAVTVGFDGVTGALATLVTADGRVWADGATGHVLGQYVYRTYNDTDYAAQGTCCYGEGGRQAAANPQRTVTSPAMTGLWATPAAATAPCTFIAALAMPALQHEYYGAPGTLWLNVTVRADGAVALDLQAFNKTATRLGEAHFVHFLPLPQADAGDAVWLMDKLGSWVDPLDTVANGGIHQHGVRDGVALASAAAPAARVLLAIDTLDAFVVNPATAADPPTMFPQPLHPLTGPVVGFDVQLMQNAFNTNTPLFSWQPDFRWRFVLRAPGGAAAA